jgi:hypothetical protein
MHDVLPRLEVGVLNFELTSSPIPGEQAVDLKDRFMGALTMSKPIITESEVNADSGIVLTGKDEIAIVAGAFPFTLAVKGVEFDSLACDPEYPWDEYQRMEL